MPVIIRDLGAIEKNAGSEEPPSPEKGGGKSPSAGPTGREERRAAKEERKKARKAAKAAAEKARKVSEPDTPQDATLPSLQRSNSSGAADSPEKKAAKIDKIQALTEKSKASIAKSTLVVDLVLVNILGL
jgi:hypothetical protein